MRCSYCGQRAGWWRRICTLCRQLVEISERYRGADFETIMTALAESGASGTHIEAFLAADPRGEGALRDRIAADMTNELLSALGQRGQQSPAEVKRIRERGNWTALGQRPRE